MALSKKEEGHIWETMVERQRRVGPDPDDHPSVRRRMELQFVSILLIINLILNKLSVQTDGAIHIKSSGRRLHATAILLTILVALGIATTSLAWMTYQDTQVLTRRTIMRSKAEYLGIALMTNPKITLKLDGNDFVITSKRGVDELLDDSFRVLHNIPPEELERLYPK